MGSIGQIRQLQKDYSVWQEAVGTMLGEEDDPYIQPEPSFLAAFGAHWDLLTQWMFISLVAFLDAYTEDVLREVFRAKPEILKSGKQLTQKEALEHKDDLVSYLAGREIESLLYRSQKEVFDWLAKKLGVRVSEGSGEELPRIRAVRNCLVHNRGKVHQRYAQDLGNLRVGQEIPEEARRVEDAAATIVAFAEDLDVVLMAKFDLCAQGGSG